MTNKLNVLSLVKSNHSRRNFIKQNTLAMGGVFMLPSISLRSIEAKYSLKQKKICCVWGGWEGHNPKEAISVFIPWLESEGAIVEVYDSLKVYEYIEVLNPDLIIQSWTFGEITSKQLSGLTNVVANGCGFVGWHGGLADSFRSNLEYQFMVGGQFLFHPKELLDYTIDVIDSNDFITEDIHKFEVNNTEQYYMLTDPNNHVLATTTFNQNSYEHYNEEMPAIEGIKGHKIPVLWKKNFNKGKVFYNSIGHFPSDFNNVALMTIQQRGILWATRNSNE